jgi:hypothetical protein
MSAKAASACLSRPLSPLFLISPSPFYTLLLPLRINPYTDGRAWARRPGCEEHGGVRRGEELTDEDEDDGERDAEGV